MPKVKSHAPVREVLAAAVPGPVAPANGIETLVEVTALAVTVGEAGPGPGVTGVEVGAGEGERGGVGTGVSGVSVTAGRRTMVGVDEAAIAPLNAAPQPLNRKSRIKNKPSNAVFLIVNTPVSNILSYWTQFSSRSLTPW